MARRGRCRCGSILNFQKGSDGYKTRCPSCGSVVRLQTVAVRAATKRQTVACPCGAAVPVRSGKTKATCPACNRELILPKMLSRRRDSSAGHGQAAHGPEVLLRFASANSEPPGRLLPASQVGPRASRTVTCEVCHTLVPAQAPRCPSCGSALALTTAAPILDRDYSSSGTIVPKSFSYKLILGWLMAGAALMVVAAIVLILSSRH